MRFLLVALLCALSYAQTGHAGCGPGTQFCGPLNRCVLVGSDSFAEQCASELDASDWVQYHAGMAAAAASSGAASAASSSSSTGASSSGASKCTYPEVFCVPMQRCMNHADANFNDYCELDNDVPLAALSGASAGASSGSAASGTGASSGAATAGTSSGADSGAAKTCTFPEVACPKMGGCMDHRHPKYNDQCELDGDFPMQAALAAGGVASATGPGGVSVVCTPPEVRCPRSGGCMNPMAPKFNDMCEIDNDFMYPGVIIPPNTGTASTGSGAAAGSSTAGSTSSSSSTTTTTTTGATSTTTTGTSTATTGTSTTGVTSSTTTTGVTSSTTTTTTTGVTSSTTGGASTTTTTTTGVSSSTTTTGTASTTTSGGTSATTTTKAASTGTTASSGAAATKCVYPQVPCPRTGGCFSSLLEDLYEETCEFDGDVPYFAASGGITGVTGSVQAGGVAAGIANNIAANIAGMVSASSCSGGEIPCPRTGGCMNPMSSNFGDLCELDGDFWIPMTNAVKCTSPQVYCPRTGGCLDQYNTKYNDICEVGVLRKEKSPDQQEAVLDTGYSTLQLFGIGSLGFVFGVSAFFTFEYCRKQRIQENEEILLEARV